MGKGEYLPEYGLLPLTLCIGVYIVCIERIYT